MEQKEILIFYFDVKRGLLSVLKVEKEPDHDKVTYTLEYSCKVSQPFTRTYLKVSVCALNRERLAEAETSKC